MITRKRLAGTVVLTVATLILCSSFLLFYSTPGSSVRNFRDFVSIHIPLLPDHSNTRINPIRTSAELAKVGIVKPAQHPFANRYDTSKLAVIVENRTPSHLIPLLLQFIAVVPGEWRFRFLGTEESIAYVNSSRMIQHYEAIGKIDLFLMPTAFKTTSKELISQTFTDPAFYSHAVAPAEHILIFQTDSILCSNAKRSLNDYLGYSYVGAPWPRSNYGGNGGLSLRHVPSMLELLDKFERQPGAEMEDLWISRRLTLIPGLVIPSSTQEKSFSVEAMWSEEEMPLGFHLGNSGSLLPTGVWAVPERRQRIYDYCPEIKIILNMELPVGWFDST